MVLKGCGDDGKPTVPQVPTAVGGMGVTRLRSPKSAAAFCRRRGTYYPTPSGGPGASVPTFPLPWPSEAARRALLWV